MNTSIVQSAASAAGTTTRRVARRPLALLLGFLMVAGAALGFSNAASAYTQVNAGGYPGAVGTPRIYGSWTGMGGNVATFPYRTVTESKRYAAYDQYVCVKMQLVYSSDGQPWMDFGTHTNCAWIKAAATSAIVNGVNFTGLMGLNSFIYSGNVQITWRLSTGRLIGYRTLDYNATGDYGCTTINCRVGMTTWGGGAFLTFPSL
jgi:hypothetical protein